MAWVELWPAMNPTANSPLAAGVTDPDAAAVPVAGGAHRCVERTGGGHATELLELEGHGGCTGGHRHTLDRGGVGCVPELAVGVLARDVLGHDLGPDVLPVGHRGDVLAGPVKAPADSTRRSPGVLAAGSVTVVVDEPAVWTRAGPEGAAGVVTLVGGELSPDTLPAPSRASTVYW